MDSVAARGQEKGNRGRMTDDRLQKQWVGS